MRVVVDRDRCESNALCVGVAPEVFRVDDDDLLHVIDESPPDQLRHRLDEAVRVCPRAALTLVE